MIVNTRVLGGHTTGVQRYLESILAECSGEYKTVQPMFSMLNNGIAGHLWEQVMLPAQLCSGDLLWSPSNTGPLAVRRQVVTLHDVVPFDHPEWLNPRFVSWYKYLQPKLIDRVEKIITISEFSKERIVEVFGVDEDKVKVVYNGVSPFPDKKNVPIPFDRYILSVGSLEPRKNLARLIKAWESLGEKTRGAGLVVVGAKGVQRIFKDAAGLDHRQENILFTGHVSNAELSFLYENAIGFCYPSLYEGFGLPPLEAMLHKTPVITSDNSALKELFSGKSILVDPYSVSSISEAIDVLLAEGGSRECVERGYDFATSLSWRECARRTYKEITG